MSATDTHVVSMPGFTYILRVILLVLSVIVLGLSANSLSTTHKLSKFWDDWSSGDVPGAIKYSAMSLVIFTSIFSFLGNSYVFVAVLFVPVAYNMWAHLSFEILASIFWLCAFAVAAATTADTADNYKWTRGETYASWATAAGSAGLGAIAWVLQVIIAIVFIVKLVAHMYPGPSGEAAGKHEMGNVAPQTQQTQSPVQQGYPVPTQTPGPYVATPPPVQWQQSPPPPHPQQGGQY